MKTILLSLSTVAFIIGVHQSFFYGVQQSYWLFMMASVGYLGFVYLKKQDQDKPDTNNSATAKKKKAPQNIGAPKKKKRK